MAKFPYFEVAKLGPQNKNVLIFRRPDQQKMTTQLEHVTLYDLGEDAEHSIKDFNDNVNHTIAQLEQKASQIVGGFSFQRKHRFLHSLKVNPNYQGQGWSRVLLDQAVLMYGKPITLHAKAETFGGLTQEQLIDFYQRVGFKSLPNDRFKWE
jgi:GNAT superfamily N-acetyltransferase